jgi:FKBP-type peptidyl-prolyl cis-trans isomerase
VLIFLISIFQPKFFEMKSLFIALLIISVGFNVNAQTNTKNLKTPAKKPVTATSKGVIKPVVFKNNLDSASYALGLSVASSFKSGGLNAINYELFNKGLRDIFTQANPSLTQEQAQEAINNLFKSFSKQREAEAMKQYASIIKEGTDFLAANKLKPGVKTTASGLQYEIITQGDGATPKASETFVVHYTGTLLNGTKFDSSVDRGQPLVMPLSDVIPGWTEGLQLMKVGSKYRFYIPYQLGYGERGSGAIPPYSTLVFDLELLGIK